MLKLRYLKPAKIFLSLIALSMASSIAVAEPNLEENCPKRDLAISNSSKYPLTFSINKMCSEYIGVTDKFSVNIVKQYYIKKACKADPSHCNMEVYSTEDCTGKSLASLTLDIKSGITNITPHSEIYKINASGFNLFFEGPWS